MGLQVSIAMTSERSIHFNSLYSTNLTCTGPNRLAQPMLNPVQGFSIDCYIIVGKLKYRTALMGLLGPMATSWRWPKFEWISSLPGNRCLDSP